MTKNSKIPHPSPPKKNYSKKESREVWSSYLSGNIGVVLFNVTRYRIPPFRKLVGVVICRVIFTPNPD